MVERYVVDLEEIDKTQLPLARGKAAHVGELLHIDGIRVPARICVTTIALRRFMASVPRDQERTGQDGEALGSNKDEAIRVFLVEAAQAGERKLARA